MMNPSPRERKRHTTTVYNKKTCLCIFAQGKQNMSLYFCRGNSARDTTCEQLSLGIIKHGIVRPKLCRLGSCPENEAIAVMEGRNFRSFQWWRERMSTCAGAQSTYQKLLEGSLTGTRWPACRTSCRGTWWWWWQALAAAALFSPSRVVVVVLPASLVAPAPPPPPAVSP